VYGSFSSVSFCEKLTRSFAVWVSFIEKLTLLILFISAYTYTIHWMFAFGITQWKVKGYMEGIKTYQKPKKFILDTIYDIIELQNGDIILSDTNLGRVQYQVTMYGYRWELLYIISEKNTEKSTVKLRVIGERKDKEKEIRREFALLDAMLEGGAEVDMFDFT